MSTPNRYRKSTDRVPLRDEERDPRDMELRDPLGCVAVIVTALAIVWNLFSK